MIKRIFVAGAGFMEGSGAYGERVDSLKREEKQVWVNRLLPTSSKMRLP